MITNTLIQGLTQPMVQARLNTADAKPFKYAQYFPVKKVNGFSWGTLTNQIEKAHVAADLHTDNGTILRKRRPIYESAKGDLPFIAISRELHRSDIREYQIALALAKDPSAISLVQYWGGDVDFCFDGINSELEYIAWALFSNAGKLSFTTGNNATFANEFDLDYGVYEEQRIHTATDWSDRTKADVLGDLKAAVKAAKGMHLNPKFAFLNLEEFYKIATSDQIVKQCATLAANLIGTANTPSLEQVNALLAGQAWLNGIQLRVIDQTITRESIDGQQTTCNPFENSRVVLTETETLGSTQYDILNENAEGVIYANRAHCVIKKYSEPEPICEVTIGQADAIPVFDTAYRCMYIKTDAQEWEA